MLQKVIVWVELEYLTWSYNYSPCCLHDWLYTQRFQLVWYNTDLWLGQMMDRYRDTAHTALSK